MTQNVFTAPGTGDAIGRGDVELHFGHTDPIRPLTDSDLAQCGTCERVWCETCWPALSARCPFEYDHDEADDNPLSDHDGAHLGRLLDYCDAAAGGGSTDELESLRDALDTAVAMLLERGVEIPRGEQA